MRPSVLPSSVPVEGSKIWGTLQLSKEKCWLLNSNAQIWGHGPPSPPSSVGPAPLRRLIIIIIDQRSVPQVRKLKNDASGPCLAPTGFVYMSCALVI